MMKVKVKAPWLDGKGLHRIGEIMEVETAAFDSLRMVEIREKAEASAEPVKPAKTTKKASKKE